MPPTSEDPAGSAPARTFVHWREPLLPGVVRLLAAEPSEGDDWDLSRRVLVVPGARAGRRLLELLVEEADARGRGLRPPRILTPGPLPELLHRPSRPIVPETFRRRAWARALSSVDRRRLQRVFPDLPGPDDHPGWTRLARVVDRLSEEVGAEGLDFADVAGAFGGGLRYDDRERWRVLQDVRARYLELLDDLGRSDRTEARRRAVEEGTVSAPGEVWLVGVAEMGGLLRRMLRSVAPMVRAVVHAPAERADAFDDLGCVLPGVWSEEEIEIPEGVLTVVQDPRAQAAEVCRVLGDGAEDLRPEDVTIGVPDPGVVPFLRQALAVRGVPHRDAAGVALDDTLPYRLLAVVADHLQGRRFAEAAALVRHPALERPLGEAAPEILDRYQARHLPALLRVPVPASSREAATAGELAERLQTQLLGEMGGRRRLSEWIPRLVRMLEDVYGEAPLRRWVEDERLVIEAFEAIRDAAATLHELPEGLDPPCSASQATRILLDEASGQVPPEPVREAVELVGWLELHLDDAPMLVLTGLNDPHVPEPAGGDAFLPGSLRSRLGLEDETRRLARDAYRLAAILASRESVRIIAGRRTASGDPLRPSRLLLTGSGEALERRVLDFVQGGAREGGAEREASTPDTGPDVAESSSDFSLPPRRVISLDPFPDVFRITEIAAMLRDPYRWALERRLGLEASHDQGRELDPLGFGSLAHAVLEAFGASEAGALRDPARVAAALDRILDERSGRVFGSRPLASVPVQIEQLRRRLRAFAERHAAWLAAGWEVLATEVEGPEEGVAFDVDGAPIRLVGRIDRVDLHREDRVVALLDYKTGDSPKDPARAHRDRSGNWTDLQLPLYRRLLPHLRSGDEPLPGLEDTRGWTVRMGYVLLPKSAGGCDVMLAEWDAAELATADETLRELIRRLRREGAVTAAPGTRPRSRWDPFATLLGGDLRLADDEGEET